MIEETIALNVRYRDRRGVVVHVTAFDPISRMVIYMREGYEHPCTKPQHRFRKEFTKVRT